MVTKMVQFYKNVRLSVVYFVMLLVVIAPYLETAFGIVDLKVKLLACCPLLLVFLLNDCRTEVMGRLTKVEESINNPEPPTYSRFPKIEDRLELLVAESLDKGMAVEIDVLGVSAKFTWPFFKRMIQRLLANPPTQLRLSVRIAVTTPVTLDEWDLLDWARESRNSIESLNHFLETHEATLAKAGIRIALFEYDNLPHWHGVMLNNQILFQGRTEWFRDGDQGCWQLRVGEVEYREFHSDDHYGGKGRIERFIHWLNRYHARAEFKGTVHSSDFDCAKTIVKPAAGVPFPDLQKRTRALASDGLVFSEMCCEASSTTSHRAIDSKATGCENLDPL